MPCPRAAKGVLARTAAVRALGALAILLVTTGAGLVAPTDLAPAAGAQQRQSWASRARPPVSVAVDSVTPRIARPGGTVTVTGTVTNDSGAALAGLSVQLRSSATPFTDRDELTEYADGGLAVDGPVGNPVLIHGSVAVGATARWRASVPASVIGMDTFGVYPLAAQVIGLSGVPLGTERTFLPFWPGMSASGLTQPLRIGWLWPLIAPPQQGICPALTTDRLAASVANGGRLHTLLAAGAAHAGRADLTWAVDPALLAGVATMTSPYTVGGTADCAGGTRKPASAAAARWLAELRSGSAGQPMMLTPYADVDVAGLTRQGLDRDLSNAYRLGRAEASAVLRRPFGSPAGDVLTGHGSATGTGTSARRGVSAGSGGIAWPAGGLADASALGNLAADGIGTVVLSSSELPPLSSSGYIPDEAVTTIPSGVGTTMTVLLADDTLTRVLGSASGAGGSAFAVSQRFLAETAMIAAEAPSLPRAVVIAPPRDWDPSLSLADSLLTDTVEAPWLKPTTLAALAASTRTGGQVPRSAPPPTLANPDQLSRSYLRQVGALDASRKLYESILHKPGAGYLDQLQEGVAAAESSAWSGSAAGRRDGAAMLRRVAGYLSVAEQKVRVVGSSVRATLGGSSGKVPVSIANGLRQSVRVWLEATPTDGRIAVSPRRELVTVRPGATVTATLSVRSTVVGNSMIRLRLVNGDGTPLPAPAVPLGVQSTQFGGTLLVIIYVALGVLLLTVGARAVRRGLRDGRSAGKVPDKEGEEQADTGAAQAGADSTGSGGADAGPAPGAANDVTDSRDPPEVPDDFADARGRGGPT